jgi:hypothetical protein
MARAEEADERTGEGTQGSRKAAEGSRRADEVDERGGKGAQIPSFKTPGIPDANW